MEREQPSDLSREKIQLSDPLLQRALDEDPVANFIATHIKQIVVVAVLSGLALVAWDRVRDAARIRMSEAVDQYQSLRRAYFSLSATEQELAELKHGKSDAQGDGDAKKREERVKELEKSQVDQGKLFEDVLLSLGEVRKPYRETMPLYRTLRQADLGDNDKIIARAGSASWAAEPSGTGQRALAELEALTLARALLDITGKDEQARTMLKQLADSAELVMTSAALALAKVAETEPQRAQALQALNSVASRFPDQTDLLREERERLNSK